MQEDTSPSITFKTSQDVDFPPHLLAHLEGLVRAEGFVTCSVSVERLGADGSNFLGRLYAVHVRGDRDRKRGVGGQHLFVKSIIPLGKLEATLDLPRAYRAEAFVYHQLAPAYAQLQDRARIPDTHRHKLAASYRIPTTDAIFLEDLSVRGYKTPHRTVAMTLDVAEAGLTQLASFHALSYAIRKEMPEFYREKLETITHPFIFGEELEQTALHVMRVAASHLERGRERVEGMLSGLVSRWRGYLLDRSPTSCLCHGDFRLNNFMIKYNGKTVEDLYVVDYQLIHIGCPINDFLYFVFTGTDRAFRTAHLHHLKQFYYTRLAESLRRFHLDPEDCFPKQEFEKEYTARLEYGLIAALYFLPFFLSNDEQIPDLGEQSVGEMDFKLLECFPQRIQGVIDDFLSWRYL